MNGGGKPPTLIISFMAEFTSDINTIARAESWRENREPAGDWISPARLNYSFLAEFISARNSTLPQAGGYYRGDLSPLYLDICIQKPVADVLRH